jgi:hypothetical protein
MSQTNFGWLQNGKAISKKTFVTVCDFLSETSRNHTVPDAREAFGRFETFDGRAQRASYKVESVLLHSFLCGSFMIEKSPDNDITIFGSGEAS